jgi:glycosyltransferase involved in cell wall biosynthesis
VLSGIVKLYKAVKEADIIHVYSNFSVPSRLNEVVSPFLYNQKGKRYFVTFTGNDIRDPKIELDRNPFFKYTYFHPLYENREYESSFNSFTRQRFFSDKNFEVIANPETFPFIRHDLFRKVHLANHPSWNSANSIDLDSVQIPGSGSTIRVLHAPSAYYSKGSNFVLDDFMKLEKKWGDKIELKLLQKVSNEEYLEELSRADILVDQLVWGWYGVAAQQAMQMGKVVLCYLSSDRIQFVPGLPIVNVNKFTLFDTLDNLIHDRALLRELGDASAEFYRNYHSPEVVAREVLTIYRS